MGRCGSDLNILTKEINACRFGLELADGGQQPNGRQTWVPQACALANRARAASSLSHRSIAPICRYIYTSYIINDASFLMADCPWLERWLIEYRACEGVPPAPAYHGPDQTNSVRRAAGKSGQKVHCASTKKCTSRPTHHMDIHMHVLMLARHERKQQRHAYDGPLMVWRSTVWFGCWYILSRSAFGDAPR